MDEDKANFEYEARLQQPLRLGTHKIYFDPDEAAVGLDGANCIDYQISKEELQKNGLWVEEVMNILSERAIRAVPNHEDEQIKSQSFSEMDLPIISRKFSILRKR